MINVKDFYKERLAEQDNTLCFKTTPLSKVFFLSLLSCGIYDIIFVLNYWKTLKDHFDIKISPFWRGLFVPLTNFKLFPVLSLYFKKYNISFNATLLAWIYFIVSYISTKVDIKSLKFETTNWTYEIISLSFILASTLIMVFVQHKINKVNYENFPDAPKNPWKASNIIWFIILLSCTVLVYLPS